jgi:putative ABC transport system ATP-binding protein
MDVAVAGKILAVEGITVAYGRTEVMRDVSIEVSPGRLLAVTGPSGAGKTTLLSAMAGLVRPIRGAVRFGGTVLKDRDHAVSEQVVIVPQDNGLAPILTAAENVQVVLVACGVNPPEARRRTVEALERVGLAEQADQLVEELSGGQQQRTALARGLALRGAVLLADEVTSELDAQSRQRVLDLLRAEADRGAAVVFATHDPEAAAACDAEVHLLDGNLEVVRRG